MRPDLQSRQLSSSADTPRMSPTPTCVSSRRPSKPESGEEKLVMESMTGSRNTEKQLQSQERPDTPSNEAMARAPPVQSKDEPEDPWVVRWDGPEDPGDPLNTPLWKKWTMTAILSVACICVTCCSSMAVATYAGMQAEFGVGQLVCVLSISLFIAGLGVGPMFLGPCSEFVGRSKVLYCSFGWFLLMNIPVAFANNIAVHLIFRFLTGLGGSAFLSVSGAVVSDTFANDQVASPMMVWSAAPFLGPVLGPLISSFINQHIYWRWTFYVILIWGAVVYALILIFVRETYSSELLRRKAVRVRKETGEERWISPVEKLDRTFLEALKKSIKTPFILLTTQFMVLFLNIWSALLLGILYLSFGGIPYIFREQHGFNLQQTGMTFLGIGAGQIFAVTTQPLFNRQYKRAVQRCGGVAPPEARFFIGYFGAILAPLGILLMGVTAFKSVHWIVPIILSSLFGMGMVFAYSSVFTYLVDAYRPVAASALASNSFMRSAFAAGFPLFGQQLYQRLGSVGATCLLGGIMCLAIPVPFIFNRIGARIRQRSTFAAS